MHPVLRGLVAAVAGLLCGLPLGFLLSPDPTGVGPLLTGVAFGLVIAVAMFVKLDDWTSETAAS